MSTEADADILFDAVMGSLDSLTEAGATTAIIAVATSMLAGVAVELTDTERKALAEYVGARIERAAAPESLQ